MGLQLFSIEHAPAALPIWQVIVEDLGYPPPRRIAKVLGMGVRTVYRYNATGTAPRAVLLALFWLTRWGRSAVHTQATNDAVLACSYLRALEDRCKQLELELRHVMLLGSSGAANDPLIGGPR